MELSKINKVVRFALNSTIVLGYYSSLVSNEETIAALIEKDIIELQKENVEKLLIFEKEKFEENMEISDDDLEYEKEYKEIFKDEEIEEIVRKEERKKP
jgi:siroheme synthase (precorrin-2 oxidase/ferrochelatase)